MLATPLNLPQRIVLVVALAGSLGLLGEWVTGGGSSLSGWTGYAPVSVYNTYAGGLQPWARVLVWLGFILVWIVASLWLLRGSAPVRSRRTPGEPLPATGTTERSSTPPEQKGSGS